MAFYTPTPRTHREALDLIRVLADGVTEIERQLADEQRKEALTPAEYLEWHERARRALRVKQRQLADLHRWVRENVSCKPQATVATKEERQQRHAERIAAYVAQANVNDPGDPVELLGLTYSIIGRMCRDGAVLTDDEQAALRVIQEYRGRR